MDRHDLPTGLDLLKMTGEELRDLPAGICKAKAAALLLKAEHPAETHRRPDLVAAADVWARLATIQS